MILPNWTKVSLIFRREVRDQLRDRRTLFMIAVLPLLLYPLMAMSFLQVTQFLKRHPSKVLVVSHDPLPADPPLVLDGTIPWLPATEADLLNMEYLETEFPSPDVARQQASSLIDQRQFDVVVCFPPGFAEHVRHIQTRQHATNAGETEEDKIEDGISTSSSEEQDTATPDLPAVSAYASHEPFVYYNAAMDNSQIAYERISFALQQYRRKLTVDDLRPRVAEPAVTVPFELSARDTSQPVRRRAQLWAKVLPFVVLVWALTGAFYPAVDICAGEKERGTLETLLSSPARRLEIVCGKLLTVMLFSVTTAVLNLICVALTSSFIVHQLSSAFAANSDAFGPPPLSTFFWLLVILLPISALFSALSLALATMARSTKEGQYYLMPLLLGFLPLMMLPTLPSAQMDLGTAIIPVTGVVLLLRLLIEGQLHQALLYAGPVLLTTAACCFFAIRWAVDQFNNENVLFRESERFSLRLWLRKLFHEPPETPTAGAAVLCGVLILVIRFFASLTTTLPTTWNGFVVVTVLSLGFLVAGPAILLAHAITSKPRQTLLWKLPKNWQAIPAAMLLAIAMHPLALALLTVVRRLYPIDESALAPLQSIFDKAPNIWCVVMLTALVPALCEELAFRGFILSGLRHLGHKWRAILISSIIFGMAHSILQQSVVAVAFGMVLGYLAVQTESLFPCMVFHAVHNALGVLASEYLPAIVQRHPQLSWAVEEISGSSGGEGLYAYGPVIILISCLLSAFILRWFMVQPYQLSDEERLCDALDHQQVGAVQ